MEVHVDRDAFMRGLQMTHNVVEPRQTLPVLANVLLEAQGDTLRMTATDLGGLIVTHFLTAEDYVATLERSTYRDD